MALETMLVYASALAILVYVIATNLTGVFAVSGINGHGAKAFAPIQSSCYISPQFNCIGASFSNKTDIFTIIFTNAAGVGLKFPPGSFGVRMRSPLQEFFGSCTPASVPLNAAEVTCTVQMGSNSVTAGQLLNPVFAVGYEACVRGSCQPELNVTGTATVYAN